MHLLQLSILISILFRCKVMTKMEKGSHLGRHLEFQRELQGDSWGLLVYCSKYIQGPILKISACYENISMQTCNFITCGVTPTVDTYYSL